MIIDLFSDIHNPFKHDNDLLEEARNVRIKLKAAMSRFNEAVDPNEIESAIYSMKELEAHYKFLLTRAKLEKISYAGIAGDKQ